MLKKAVIKVVIITCLGAGVMMFERPVNGNYYLGIPLNNETDWILGLSYAFYGNRYLPIWQGNAPWRSCNGRFSDYSLRHLREKLPEFFRKGSLHYVLDNSLTGYVAYIRNAQGELLSVSRYPPGLGGENVGLDHEVLCQPEDPKAWSRLQNKAFELGI